MGWSPGGRGLERLHNKRILHGDLKASKLFVVTGAPEPVIKIGDLGCSLRLDAFMVESASNLQRGITSFNYAAPEMLLDGIGILPHIELGTNIFFGLVHLGLCVNSTPLSLPDSLNRDARRPSQSPSPIQHPVAHPRGLERGPHPLPCIGVRKEGDRTSSHSTRDCRRGGGLSSSGSPTPVSTRQYSMRSNG